MKREREEEEARKKMEQLYINQYKPPVEYQNQFKD
jgi:hypothetical protein